MKNQAYLGGLTKTEFHSKVANLIKSGMSNIESNASNLYNHLLSLLEVADGMQLCSEGTVEYENSLVQVFLLKLGDYVEMSIALNEGNVRLRIFNNGEFLEDWSVDHAAPVALWSPFSDEDSLRFFLKTFKLFVDEESYGPEEIGGGRELIAYIIAKNLGSESDDEPYPLIRALEIQAADSASREAVRRATTTGFFDEPKEN